MKSQQKLSLMSKMVILVSVPCATLLVATAFYLFSVYESKKAYDETVVDVESIQQVSLLIGTLQVERGMSAVYLKSKGANWDGLKKRRLQSDGIISKSMPALNHIADKLKSAAQVRNSIQNIGTLRALVEANGQLSEVLTRYTSIITGLRESQKNLAEFSKSQIAAKIRSYALLETARENSGLLRANLSAVLSEDLPIDNNMFFKLLSLHSGMMSNLNSDGLYISPKSKKLIGNFEEREHWKMTHSVFKTVLELSQEGGFGFDGNEFFGIISKCVNDIAHLLKVEGTDIKEQAVENSEQAFKDILYISGFFILFLLIMLQYLNMSIRKAKKSTQEITSGIEKISVGLVSTSTHLATNSNVLKTSVTKQADSIEETAASMEELSAMTKNNVENASKSAQSAKDSISIVNQTLQSMQELLESMDNISKSTETVSEISRVMEDIKDKTGVIDEIVFKTKLLSFNASVEAERAGDHGRGFSVVAEEIGHLAQLSGKAAFDIAKMIKSSMTYTKQIADDNKEAVANGKKFVDQTASLLDKIKLSTESISKDSISIDSASKEQATGLSQINSALDSLDRTTQTNQDSAEQTYLLGKRLSQQARLLDEALRNLHAHLDGKSDSNIEDLAEHKSFMKDSAA